MPSRRAWLALVAIVLLNVFFAFIYRQLPAGEAPTPQGADLAEEISGPLSVLVLLGSILLIAALPEELVLRVGFQPRLAAFMGIGLAIVVQALLFSMGHVPQQMLRYERSPLIALAYVLPIENGLIAGYMWYRTKSLPLLLLLHLFAFPRFGRWLCGRDWLTLFAVDDGDASDGLWLGEWQRFWWPAPARLNLSLARLLWAGFLARRKTGMISLAIYSIPAIIYALVVKLKVLRAACPSQLGCGQSTFLWFGWEARILAPWSVSGLLSKSIGVLICWFSIPNR
jgi:hypothetical protein